MRDNFIQLAVHFEDQALTTYEDREALTLANMIGSIGGSLNLWAGISFLTILELLELFYRLASPSRKKSNTKDLSSNTELRAQKQSAEIQAITESNGWSSAYMARL